MQVCLHKALKESAMSLDIGAMDIFKRITKDHRELEKIVEDLIETSGDEAARRKGFKEFVARFKAHAAAEEEVLYARLFEDEKTRGKAAHSVKEHEEARSLIEKLEGRDYDEAQWLKDAKQLAHDTKHHHEEEEQDTFLRLRTSSLSTKPSRWVVRLRNPGRLGCKARSRSTIRHPSRYRRLCLGLHAAGSDETSTRRRPSTSPKLLGFTYGPLAFWCSVVFANPTKPSAT